MSSRKRSWIQDGPMYRGVPEREGKVWEHSGPYDTAAKARASVAHWVRAGGYGEESRRSGYIQTANPVWVTEEAEAS